MSSAAVDEAALPLQARDWRLRQAEGHAARERAPRRDLGRWDAVDHIRDAVAILLAQNAVRAEDLLPVRNGRMAASPWTFSRAEEAVAACLRAYRERMTGYSTARWLDIWYDLIAVDQFLGVFADPGKIRAAAHIERKARKRTHGGAFRKLTEHRDGRDRNDPLFLQIKQAGMSVYEPSCGPSRYDNHGRRVVEGKRLAQSATDIFVGWTAGRSHDYYVRQLRNMKVIADGELSSPRLGQFATACGKVLARSHARTGDPVAVAAYIGKGRAFDEAMDEFANTYADQTEHDHRQLVDALASGLLPSAPGW